MEKADGRPVLCGVPSRSEQGFRLRKGEQPAFLERLLGLPSIDDRAGLDAWVERLEGFEPVRRGQNRCVLGGKVETWRSGSLSDDEFATGTHT
jgi:hypothetical protein